MIKERCGVALPNSPPLKKVFERLLESYPNTMGSSYTSLSLSLWKRKGPHHHSSVGGTKRVWYLDRGVKVALFFYRRTYLPFWEDKPLFEYKVWTFRVRLKKRKKKQKNEKKIQKKCTTFFLLFSLINNVIFKPTKRHHHHHPCKVVLLETRRKTRRRCSSLPARWSTSRT